MQLFPFPNALLQETCYSEVHPNLFTQANDLSVSLPRARLFIGSFRMYLVFPASATQGLFKVAQRALRLAELSIWY